MDNQAPNNYNNGNYNGGNNYNNGNNGNNGNKVITETMVATTEERKTTITDR